jgi:hypothetical protein
MSHRSISNEANAFEAVMEISYVNNVDDLVAALEHQAEHVARIKPTNARRITPTAVISVVILFASVLGLIASLFAERSREGFTIFPIACVLAGLLLLFSSRRFHVWLFRRSADKNIPSSDLLRPQHMTLTPEAVMHRTEHASGSTEWAGIQHVGITATHIFIFTTSTTAFVVPRRAFASDESFNEFAQTAQKYREIAFAQPRASGESRDWAGAAKAFQVGQVPHGIQAPETNDALDHIRHDQ